MITGNRLKFGYGDVGVGSCSLLHTMCFQQIDPRQKCGDPILEDTKFIGEKIIIEFSYEDYCEFIQKIKQVKEKIIHEFSFKGYVFDFENYNSESIRLCEEHAFNAIRLYVMCMAA